MFYRLEMSFGANLANFSNSQNIAAPYLQEKAPIS
jgi:hypothetical protein